MLRGDIAVHFENDFLMMLAAQQVDYLDGLAQRTRYDFLTSEARIDHQQVDAIDIVENLFQYAYGGGGADGKKAFAAKRFQPVESPLHLISTLIVD